MLIYKNYFSKMLSLLFKSTPVYLCSVQIFYSICEQLLHFLTSRETSMWESLKQGGSSCQKTVWLELSSYIKNTGEMGMIQICRSSVVSPGCKGVIGHSLCEALYSKSVVEVWYSYFFLTLRHFKRNISSYFLESIPWHSDVYLKSSFGSW